METDAGPQILIVEDSPVEAEMIRRALTRAGYRTTLAQNGEEGLSILREHPHALVMSDIQMPLMNGYQLCREVKRDTALRNTPLILLSALSEPEDIIEAVKAGADSYVTKPFVEAIMLEQIHALLATPLHPERMEGQPPELIEYNGSSHFIAAGRQQILNLLLSVYRNTIAQNRELTDTRIRLNQLNSSLEQKVLERTAALQESEVRIRAILDTALDAFVVMDSNGMVAAWNAEAERLFGYPREEAVGRKLADLIVPPAYREAHARGLAHFLETGEGSLVGGRIEVTAISKDQNEFPIELSITSIREGNSTFFSAFARDITERKRAESKINFMAYHDRLTELPNRELFYDRMSQAIAQARRKHGRLALLFLDLDGFKDVNDRYGHEAGDTVLKVVAKRMHACVRGVDTVARLGGDEFTIILVELEKAADASNIAKKIIQKLSEPIILNDSQRCGIGASIGISLYPEDGYELDKLMSAADAAMYESKAVGRNTYTFFRKAQAAQEGAQNWVALDAAYLLGVPEIDSQHQELAGRINNLNEAVKGMTPIDATARMFDELLSSVELHFETEERLMAKSGYAEDEEHRLGHQRLLGEINHLRTKFTEGSEALALQSLKDWLLSHIDTDKHLARHLTSQRRGNS